MRLINPIECPNCRRAAYSYQIFGKRSSWLFCNECHLHGLDITHNKTKKRKIEPVRPYFIEMPIERLGSLNNIFRRYFGARVMSFSSYHALCDFVWWISLYRTVSFPIYAFPGQYLAGYVFDRPNKLRIIPHPAFKNCPPYGIGLTDAPLKNLSKDVYIFPFIDLPKALITAIRVKDPIAYQLTFAQLGHPNYMSYTISLLQCITGQKVFFWPLPKVNYPSDYLLRCAWISYRSGAKMCLYSNLEKEMKGSVRDFINTGLARKTIFDSKEFLQYIEKKSERKLLPWVLLNRESIQGVKQLLLGDGTPLDFVDGYWFCGPTPMLNFSIEQTIIELGNEDEEETWTIVTTFEGKTKEIKINANSPFSLLRQFKKKFLELFGVLPICKVSSSGFMDFVLAHCPSTTGTNLDVCQTQ